MSTIKNKKAPLPLIIWANIIKWKTIRGISDEMLSACLGVKDLRNRKVTYYMSTDEMGRVCDLLQIEPEKLLER